MENKIELKEVKTEEDFSSAKILILEYVNWLGIDLSSQNFDHEVSTMPETYGAPNGGLCIVLRNNKAVGVAGIKRFNETECEVKRMYVQPESRGLGIGKLLLTQCIEIAKRLNYDKAKLDTADFMKAAIKLYTDNGFIEIPAYRHNPYEEEARFFELKLK
jgi:GNAT superfamily N-acetyltransferase